MDNSHIDCRMTALKLLVSEFVEKKYAEFVKQELNRLENREKEEIGFQSEADDVVLDLSLNGGFIKYEYWDESLGDYVKGEGSLEYKVVVNEILRVTG